MGGTSSLNKKYRSSGELSNHSHTRLHKKANGTFPPGMRDSVLHNHCSPEIIPEPEKRCVHKKVETVKVPEADILRILRVHDHEERLRLLPEIRQDIDGPAVGPVDDLPEPAPVNSQGNPPCEKEDEPDIVFYPRTYVFHVVVSLWWFFGTITNHLTNKPTHQQ